MDELVKHIAEGIPAALPTEPAWDDEISHAPAHSPKLNQEERKLAVANALRYFPSAWHEALAEELAKELQAEGRIYARRFRPTQYPMKAHSLEHYPARCPQAAALMMMIQNNLDPAVAQHPHELVTYGGNGSVFQNWAQYRLTMQYLSQMTEEQTLVLYSGHPMGLFPSHPDAPRLVITNGMVIPHFSDIDEYERLSALGVTMYGQMTAGSFMYIGPQGIVHGTTITLLNAGRLYLGLQKEEDLRGKLFVSSGLGGMSGAQAKAAVIAGAIGVIAEVNPHAVAKRHEQGWVQEVSTDLDHILRRIAEARAAREPLSLAYQGNIVDLLEKFDQEDVHVDLGSDQTSLHNPYAGGYYPAGLSLEDANRMMKEDQDAFREAVHASLRRHFAVIQRLTAKGMYFWDYGNAFLVQAQIAGAEGVTRADGRFSYPSYVEDIMGPSYFDYGFGPFRWIATSCDPQDLRVTDQIAAEILEKQLQVSPPEIQTQINDNLRWIREAESYKLVVGSQARILYSDAWGRIEIARAFNKAIAEGRIKQPIVLGRDHHDVSGVDSPYRETANIYDGSSHCADMAIQNVIGDAFRGATWVSIHNGGGVGWGKVINGGFGLVLDGSEEAERRLAMMLYWDVNNGIARRAWARNPSARFAIQRAMEMEPKLQVTLPHEIAPDVLSKIFPS
ncbi:MAG: urocanate hydratase [Myxococcales bacterium]|nr:urocanate hydratase [Myxococcales bacterium]